MKYTILLLFLNLSAFAQTDTTIYQVVEEMPRFPGCEDLEGTTLEKKHCADKKMLAFIYKNIKYPTIAREQGIESTIVASFIIEKDGSISNIKIIRGESKELQQMMFDLLNILPKFDPGKHKGVPVRVQFNLPMRIHLE